MVPDALRWAIRDLDALPDDGGWNRYEVIDGNLYVTRAPQVRHQRAGGKIFFELEFWSRQTGLGEPLQTPGVIFTPNDAVIPDIVWVSSARLENRIDEAGHLIVSPELLVEILSPGNLNEQRDAAAGVPGLRGTNFRWMR